MNKTFYLATILCLLLTSICQAQESDLSKQKFKFGKIDLSEFDTKPPGVDSAASAVVLFDIGTLSFEINNKTGWFCVVINRTKRIKINNKQGYDYANISVPLYKKTNSGEEILYNLSGSTYTLENGKIITSKMTDDARFTDDFNSNYQIKKFTLPNVTEGSIIEYKYTIKSDFYFTLTDWYFQDNIPVLWSDFSISIPEWFNYKRLSNITSKITELPVTQTQQTFSGFYSTGAERPETYNFTSQSRTNRWIGKNLPAVKDEDYVAAARDHQSNIQFELISTKFPSGVMRSYSTSWEQIVGDLKDDVNFGRFIKNTNSISAVLSTIIKPEMTPRDKVENIFNYVKSNVKWNGSYRLYSSKNNSKAIFESKTGGSADINLALTSLLNAAGLTSYPVLISTRSHGSHPGFPIISKFNSVISTVKIDSTYLLLDATSPTNAVDLISYQCLNHKGLVIDLENKTADWMTIEASNASRSSSVYQVNLKEDGSISGKFFVRKTDYDAVGAINSYNKNGNDEDYVTAFKNKHDGLQVSKYIINQPKSLSEGWSEEYDFELEEAADLVGDKIFLTPNLLDRIKENPFKLDERDYPVDFGYPQESTFRMLLTLPEKCTVESLPPSLAIRLSDNSASFSASYLQDGNTIAMTSKLTLNSSYYSPEQYFELKELFKNVVNKQSEHVIIKKAQ